MCLLDVKCKNDVFTVTVAVIGTVDIGVEKIQSCLNDAIGVSLKGNIKLTLALDKWADSFSGGDKFNEKVQKFIRKAIEET